MRKIFNLCLAGRGPSQIARDLENEKIMTPTAYYASTGRVTRNPVPTNPYLWASDAVKHILENRQYTGCAVNFKSTTVSFKVHKKIYNPVEEQQIIPNMQEPIISEELFDRVQELRCHKRGNTRTGRKILFAGLLYCPDCGAKLHFCAAKSLKPNQEFYPLCQLIIPAWDLRHPLHPQCGAGANRGRSGGQSCGFCAVL